MSIDFINKITICKTGLQIVIKKKVIYHSMQN
jgi:hypothetical protein